MTERVTRLDKTNGYLVTNVAGHPLFPGKRWVNYHRVLMAEHLNRELLSSEIVHHKDGNKLNNHLSNLVLHTRGSHASEHGKGRKFSEETRKIMSEKAKIRNADPEYNKLLSERAKKQHAEGKLGYGLVKDKEASVLKRRESLLQFYADKEKSAKNREKSSERMRKTQKRLWSDEEYRRKMSPILSANANAKRSTIKPQQANTDDKE